MKPTPADKLDNRRRMDALGLRVEAVPEKDRAGYIRGNLAVHMALQRMKKRASDAWREK